MLGCETTVDPVAHESKLNAVDESVLIVDANAQKQQFEKY